MIERIQEIVRRKHLTPSQFADEIGIQRSGMSHLLSGRNNPSLEFVMKVLKRYPDVKADWLLYGTAGEATGQPVTDELPFEPGGSVNGFMPIPGQDASVVTDAQELPDQKPEIKLSRTGKKEKPGRKIEKIVVFYDDRTFREYEPEQ